MNALDLLAPIASIDGNDYNLRIQAGLHSADSLICLAAGARASEAHALMNVYGATGIDALHRAAATAAAIIRFTEWDDIHVASCVTVGAIAVPVATLLAKSDVAFTSALGCGYSFGIALGEAIGGGAALPETWPTLLAAPAIAAVTAATALGLTAEQKAHALVIAMAGSSGRNGRPIGWPSARWLAIGEATLKGLRAALAAGSSFKGDLDLLSREWLDAQSHSARGWSALSPDAIASVGVKPYVTARQGLNAMEAFRQTIAEGLDPLSITDIRVLLPPEAVAVVSRPLNFEDRLSTIANLGFQLGIIAFEPERLTDLDRSRPFKPEVYKLAERVTVRADTTIAGRSLGTWPATLDICVGSRRFQQTCRIAPGDPGDVKVTSDLIAKKASVSLVDDDVSAIAAILRMDEDVARRASDLLRRSLAAALPQTTLHC